MEPSSSSCAELGLTVDLGRCLGDSLELPKPHVMFDGESVMNLKPMQVNWASSRVDFGTWSCLRLAVLNFVFL